MLTIVFVRSFTCFFKGKKGVLYYFTVFRILQKIIHQALSSLLLSLNPYKAFSASFVCNNSQVRLQRIKLF